MSVHVNRRSLLIAAPAAGVALVAGQAEAAQETPVRRAFDEWSAYRDWLNGPETNGMRREDFDELVEKADDQASALLKLPAQTAQDFIMKVIASTDWGSCGMPDSREMPQLWAEARALIG